MRISGDKIWSAYFSLSSVTGSYLTVPGIKPPHRWLGFLPPSLPGAFSRDSWLSGVARWQGHLTHSLATLSRREHLFGFFPAACAYRKAPKGLRILQDRHQNFFFLISIFSLVLLFGIKSFIGSLESLETIGRWNEGGKKKNTLHHSPESTIFSEFPSCLFFPYMVSWLAHFPHVAINSWTHFTGCMDLPWFT